MRQLDPGVTMQRPLHFFAYGIGDAEGWTLPPTQDALLRALAHPRWQRVLAGAYTDPDAASQDAVRLRNADPSSDARVLSAGDATGVAAVTRAPDEGGRRSGI